MNYFIILSGYQVIWRMKSIWNEFKHLSHTIISNLTNLHKVSQMAKLNKLNGYTYINRACELILVEKTT